MGTAGQRILPLGKGAGLAGGTERHTWEGRRSGDFAKLRGQAGNKAAQQYLECCENYPKQQRLNLRYQMPIPRLRA